MDTGTWNKLIKKKRKKKYEKNKIQIRNIKNKKERSKLGMHFKKNKKKRKMTQERREESKVRKI